MAYSGNTHFGPVKQGNETVGATSAQLTATPGLKGVIFQADHGNAGPIYLMYGATATAANGWRLNAGESITLLLPTANLNEWRAISDGAGRTLKWIGV